MKALIIALALLLGSSQAYANKEVIEACDIARELAADLVGQFPLQVDSVTSLVGMVPMYLAGKCTVLFNYVLDEDAVVNDFIGSVKRESAGRMGITRGEAIEYMNTLQFRKEFIAYTRKRVSPDLVAMTELPGVVVKMNYAFDKGNVTQIAVHLP